MSFKEVKELRKEGKLNEALEMALTDFEANWLSFALLLPQKRS